MYRIDGKVLLIVHAYLSLSFLIEDSVLYDQILLPIFLLSLLTRNRAELNTITSERTDEKLREKERKKE